MAEYKGKARPKKRKMGCGKDDMDKNGVIM